MRLRWLLLILLALGLSPSLPSAPPSDSSPLRPHERSSLEAAIAALEYRASWSGGELQAPNRAHDLRTFFGADGVRVHDRTAPGSPLLVALRATRIGRASALAPIPAGELHSEASRVEIRRPGVVEWYENRPDGLEQGFTLAERPPGNSELVLALALDGAGAELRNGELALRSRSSGRQLEYSKLVALDAAGRTLPSRMELAGEREAELRLVVDDADAQYPVVVDPLIRSTADARLESDEPDATLGHSVASAGDVNGDGFADVIVGAPHFDVGVVDTGAAFVFLGSATGVVGTEPGGAHAILAGPNAGSYFGWSVAGAGDVNGDGFSDVVIGAPQWAAAYVFHGSALGIPSAGADDADGSLLAEDLGSFFGDPVAGAGDVNGDGYADVVVGAGEYTNGEEEEGAVFIFHGGPSGVGNAFDFEAATVIESNQDFSILGADVASAGDLNRDGYAEVVAVAASYTSGATAESAVFVFHGRPGGIPDMDAAGATTILRSDQPDAPFGSCASSAGDVNGDGYGDLIVGAARYDSGQPDEGAAFVFHGGASGIPDGSSATAQARIESNQPNARLALCASAGDVNGDGYGDVIVGAPDYDAGEIDEGAAFVFLGRANGIGNVGPNAALAQLESNETGSGFGFAVASAGDVNGDGFDDVIVGSPDHVAGEDDEGAAFVYHGGGLGIANGTAATAAGRAFSTDPGAGFGNVVASAGDVNGDGFPELIVGAPTFDGGEADEGAAFVYRATLDGIGVNPTPFARFESDQASARLGSAVSGGDANNDGFADVIVGAPNYQSGQSGEGAAFVFLSGPAGLLNGTPATAAAHLQSNQVGALLGSAVSLAGDVNGDGFADAIVGAPRYAAGQVREGAVFIFHGGPLGIGSAGPTGAATRLESNQTDSDFGFHVAFAGDVNGDMFGDVIVGAMRYDSGQDDEGAAFVFHGSTSGVAFANPASAATRIESNQDGAQLGSVAAAGDVNGDGLADVIVGAWTYTADVANDGAAYVFHGDSAGIADGNPATAPTTLVGAAPDSAFGFAVSGLGDVDGDGFGDVIVGAFAQDVGALDQAGAAYVFNGGPLGIQPTGALGASTTFSGTQAGGFLGYSAAGADVNGDGFADALVGAPTYSPTGVPSGGAAFVFGANGGIPRGTNRARQRSLTLSLTTREVAPWGSSDRTNRVEINLVGRYPAGRQAYGVELEFCPKSFGVLECERRFSGWQDSGSSSGINTTLSVFGLDPGRLHRWRARLLHAPVSVLEPGITPPPNPPHGRWLRPGAQANEGDFRIPPDADFDGVTDVADNCPTVANTMQLDADGDLVGDACDNCTAVANPRVSAGFLGIAPWATLTGQQRDDDHDGYGNVCDAKFPGVAGALVGAGDLVQFRASNGKDRSTDACGTTGTRPCAIFDLDEGASLVGAGDLARFRALNGKLPGPTCAACPLPCAEGAEGSCGAIP